MDPAAFRPAPFVLSPRDALANFLRHCIRPARLLIAISGGSDSTGLLLGLYHLIAEDPAFQGISLYAVTVDHALRAESADEAALVAALCRQLSIPHVIRRWEDEKPRSAVSAAAREARYRLLVEVADEIGASCILTGHTLDDQLETVAMRSERSQEDASGLSGMAPVVLLHRRHYLVRPLLHTRRQAIREALMAQGYGWIDDPSNLDPHYERVRMRGRLQGAGVDADAALAGMQAAALARRSVCEAAARLLEQHLTIEHGVLACLDHAALATEWPVLRQALAVLAAILGGREHLPASDGLRRLSELLHRRDYARLTIGRVLFDLRRDGLYLVREARGLPSIEIPPGKTLIWDGRFRLRNAGEVAVTIEPQPAGAGLPLFAGRPAGLARLARRVMPHWGAPSDAADFQTVHQETVLAPYDRFLPQFDWPIAQVISVKLGMTSFLSPPFSAFERKT